MSSLTLNGTQHSRGKVQINTYGNKDEYPRQKEGVCTVVWTPGLYEPAPPPQPAGDS